MIPNPYRAWLLGIALSLMFVGFLIWLMGIYSRFLQGPLGPLGEDIVGISEIAWGSGLVLVGAVFLVFWLAVSAILHGLHPQAAGSAAGPAGEHGDRSATAELAGQPEHSL